MLIKGQCHCENIRFRLNWPNDDYEIPVRECGCTFCRKHAGAWTSHRDAELVARIDDESSVAKYRFGTNTAEFYVCTVCGAVPFVISEIENHLYAVVNVNTFEDIEKFSFARSSTNFDNEETNNRLQRRQRNWIQSVNILMAENTA